MKKKITIIIIAILFVTSIGFSFALKKENNSNKLNTEENKINNTINNEHNTKTEEKSEIIPSEEEPHEDSNKVDQQQEKTPVKPVKKVEPSQKIVKEPSKEIVETKKEITGINFEKSYVTKNNDSGKVLPNYNDEYPRDPNTYTMVIHADGTITDGNQVNREAIILKIKDLNKLIVTPEYLDPGEITYTSSNKEMVIENDNIIINNYGSTVITAKTKNNLTASFTLKVIYNFSVRPYAIRDLNLEINSKKYPYYLGFGIWLPNNNYNLKDKEPRYKLDIDLYRDGKKLEDVIIRSYEKRKNAFAFTYDDRPGKYQIKYKITDRTTDTTITGVSKEIYIDSTKTGIINN